jgi:hypothetical protein
VRISFGKYHTDTVSLLKLLIYAKKLLKVIFGALRELYLNYAWKNSSSTLKMARTCIFLIAIIFFDL